MENIKSTLAATTVDHAGQSTVHGRTAIAAKELSVVTCSCGGKIPWNIREKSDFCPYCGMFLNIID
jgi:hypothetical protein